MSSLSNRQMSAHNSRKKVTVTCVIRDEVEKHHRSGVNSLEFDPHLNRLYSAGRDSIIRIWNLRNMKDPYCQSMEHHTDWCNDIVICCNGKNLISASSDTTVKVWNAHKGFCMSTLRTHKDYVKALAYAKDKEQVASAGLDKAIFLWDVNTLTALTTSNNMVTTSSLAGNKDSVYSLAMNPSGTVIASGSTEKVIRIWDPRSSQKLMKLKGHSDNVRALIISRDGTQCLSASSDSTIRLWSLGQQRCVAKIKVHDEGVWALQINESFTQVFSGGRDKKIVMTDLRNPANKVVICEESAPILKIILDPSENGSLWVATTDSCIKNWSLRHNLSYNFNHKESDCDLVEPLNSKPDMVIKGNPALRQYHVLNDKRFILTKDTDSNVAIYDVLKATKVEDLGQVDMEEEIKKRFKMIYVPNWFSVDLKSGMLAIHLEEPDCLSAWVSAKEFEFTSAEDCDSKVNLGSLLLQALLGHWLQNSINENENREEDGSDDLRRLNSYFSVPPHTPIIISESNRTILRLLVGESRRESEHNLREILPGWLTDAILSRNLPKFTKTSFLLLPHPSLGIKSCRRERLTASDLLQVRKLIEHVCEKMIGSNCENGQQNPSNSQEKDCFDKDDDKCPEEKLELLCGGPNGEYQVLDPNMDLRSVRHFYWKSGPDLILNYRPIK